MIPELDADGFLPQGTHDTDLIEVEKRFARFQRSDRRRRLFEKLRHLLEALERTNLVRYVLIDGSFVTAKDEPNDVDLIVVLPSELPMLGTTLPPTDYNVLSRRRVSRDYGFDAVHTTEGSKMFDFYLDLFTRDRDVSRRKGILRIWLGK